MKYGFRGCEMILWPLLAFVVALLLWMTLGCAHVDSERGCKCATETETCTATAECTTGTDLGTGAEKKE